MNKTKFEDIETNAEPMVPTPPSWNPSSGALDSGMTYNSHPVPPSGINGAPSFDPGLIQSSFGRESVIDVNASPGLSSQPGGEHISGPAWDDCPIKGGL